MILWTSTARAFLMERIRDSEERIIIVARLYFGREVGMKSEPSSNDSGKILQRLDENFQDNFDCLALKLKLLQHFESANQRAGNWELMDIFYTY